MFLSYGLSSASLNARSTSPPASFIIPRYHPSPVLSFQPSFSLELYLVHQMRPSHRGKKIRIRTVIARVKSDLATIPADSSSSVDLRTFLFVSLVSFVGQPFFAILSRILRGRHEKVGFLAEFVLYLCRESELYYRFFGKRFLDEFKK